MGDLNPGLWTTKSVMLFVAAQQRNEHFSELLVLVEQRTTTGRISNASHALAASYEGFSTVGFLLFLLFLFGVDHVLSYVSKVSVKRNASRVRPQNNLAIEGIKEDIVVQENIISVAQQARKSDEEIGEYPLYIECGFPHTEKYFHDLQEKLRAGVANNSLPQRADDGTSGVYFMRDTQGKRLAVFKPAHEEGVNVADYKGGDIRPGCPPGEGFLKEVAAYMLDKDGFHGVPHTTLATCASDMFGNSQESVKVVGSLQEFVPSESSAEEIGWGRITRHDVHKIGLLDCRILNKDRHLGNILVTEDEAGCHLVPIDHGLSLPSTVMGGGSFEWLQFPHCKQPFDEDTVDFVRNIDADRDVQLLRQLPGVREECIETMKICTIFLKKCVKRGMTLYQIGRMMSRYDDEQEMCALEKMYIRVGERTQGGSQDYWCIVEEEIDRTLANK